MNHPKERARFGSHLGLERIREVCRRMKNPERSYPVVHVAGTNGKGSVASFIAQVLFACGYRVGLYTSPHLLDYRERFMLNFEWIKKEDLSFFYQRLEPVFAEVERDFPHLGPITEFEATTAIAYAYYASAKVDIAVMEVGLGGRLDATNVVCPVVSVITSIGHDHTEWLGDTLSLIAYEKAGIIKENTPVVIGKQEKESIETLRRVAKARHAPFYSVEDMEIKDARSDAKGGSFFYGGDFNARVEIGLLGKHQLDNALLALRTLKVLQSLNYVLPKEKILLGMKQCFWPGRMEILQEDPFILLDGAHNQEALEVLAQNLASLWPKETFTFVVALLLQKDLDMLLPLLPIAKEILCTRPKSSRLPPQSPESLRDYVIGKGVKSRAFSSVEETLEGFPAGPIVVCGSLYLVSEMREKLLQGGGFKDHRRRIP